MCTFETPLLFVCVSSLLDTKTIKDGGSEVILQNTHVGHVFNLDNCLLQKKDLVENCGHCLLQNPINDLRWRKLVLKNHTPAASINVSTDRLLVLMFASELNMRHVIWKNWPKTYFAWWFGCHIHRVPRLDLVAVGRPSFSGRGQWSLLISVGSMLLCYMRIRNHTVDGRKNLQVLIGSWSHYLQGFFTTQVVQDCVHQQYGIIKRYESSRSLSDS